MEKEQAQAIIRALRAHETAKAMKAIAGDFAVGDLGEASMWNGMSHEEWATSGWADVAARDLGYEAAETAIEIMGIAYFGGPHGGDDWRAKLARRMAWRMREVVRETIKEISQKAEWPYEDVLM